MRSLQYSKGMHSVVGSVRCGTDEWRVTHNTNMTYDNAPISGASP